MAARASAAGISTESRCSSRVGPRYQGIRADRAVTLSPNRADSGIAATEASPRSAAKAENRVAISSKQRSLETDEIHLVDGEHDMPDAEQRADEGVPPGLRQARPCAHRPASPRDRQVEAPVAMLRVYCSWPGRVGDDEGARSAWRKTGRRHRS